MSPPQIIAVSLAASLRTADAANIDDAVIFGIEDRLLALSDEIAAFYLTHNDRAGYGAGGARVIYDIRQITSYSYASKVSYARHVLRLTPVDRPGQHVHASALDIDPAPVGRREGTDFFGNHMTWIALNAPHDRLVVKVAARVTVEDIDYHDLFGAPPWEELRDAVFMTTDFGPMSPAHFVFPSRQVPLDPEIREYARESFPPGRPVLDGAIELMRRIKDGFRL